MTFILYIRVDFTLGLLDCVRYNEDFIILQYVISRFCSIHFTVTLFGLKNIVRYTEVLCCRHINVVCFHQKVTPLDPGYIQILCITLKIFFPFNFDFHIAYELISSTNFDMFVMN